MKFFITLIAFIPLTVNALSVDLINQDDLIEYVQSRDDLMLDGELSQNDLINLIKRIVIKNDQLNNLEFSSNGPAIITRNITSSIGTKIVQVGSISSEHGKSESLVTMKIASTKSENSDKTDLTVDIKTVETEESENGKQLNVSKSIRYSVVIEVSKKMPQMESMFKVNHVKNRIHYKRMISAAPETEEEWKQARPEFATIDYQSTRSSMIRISEKTSKDERRSNGTLFFLRGGSVGHRALTGKGQVTGWYRNFDGKTKKLATVNYEYKAEFELDSD